MKIEFQLLFFIILNLIIFIKIKQFCNYINIVDKPNSKRKIHTSKAYLVGGHIFFLNIILYSILNYNNLNNSFFFFSYVHILSFFISIIFIFVLGVLDDKYDLSPYTKTFVLAFVFYFLVEIDNTLAIERLSFNYFDFKIYLKGISIFFSIFCCMILINAFNMFDGINMQLALYVLSVICIFIFKFPINYFLILFFFLLVFFLCLNYKGFIFLGNSGSFLLSFIIIFFILKFYNLKKMISAEEVVLLLIYPVLDLLRLFVLRISNGNNPFIADNNHIHHIFLKLFKYNLTVFIIFLSYFIPNFLYFFLNFNFVFCFLLLLLFYSLIFIFKYCKIVKF